MGPIIAEEGGTGWHLFYHESPLKGDGRDVVQQGFHRRIGEESFGRGIDTATSGLFLLVEDAEEGLGKVLCVLDYWKGRGFRLFFL